MTPRVLLAWESGAGRGHIQTLRQVALALDDACVFDAALSDMTHVREIAPLCELAFPAARLPYDRSRRRGPDAIPTATWADFLGDSGFRDADFLQRQVRWWQEAIVARQSDLVVADYAPCALLAARSLGIPTVVTGTGYGIPPENLPRFPNFLPEYEHALYDEAEIVGIVNGALRQLGVPKLGRLSDIYRRDEELVRTLDLLDPYAPRTKPLLPPVADVADPEVAAGEEVFVYFSTTELDDSDVVDALTKLSLPVRAFCPNIARATAAKLASAGVILEDRPVPVAWIARNARMVVHAGQHGILCLGLAAGLPQLALPQHLEQLYHARRIAESGCGRVLGRGKRPADTFIAAILSIYEDEAMRTAAQRLARELAPAFAVDARSMIRSRLLPLLTGAPNRDFQV